MVTHQIVRLWAKDPTKDWKEITWDNIHADIRMYIPGLYAKGEGNVIYIYKERS